MERDTEILVRFVQIIIFCDPLAMVSAAASLIAASFRALREMDWGDLRMNSLRPI